MSREVPDSPPQTVAPMSALLQERLERERRVESERSSIRGVNELSDSSADSRTLRSPSPSDHRPISSGGSDTTRKKNGLGVKEMEQTLSNLHKQNFDLKLELFHRREKQNALEERLEKAEVEKADTEAMNERLLVELEKRDKAVEEAVGMIVMLEARVEQLLREREMVRQIEEQGLPYTDSTPHSKPLQPPASDESKGLNRMPSFVSEKVENTENLRNVYLGTRSGSALSVPTTAEASPDTTRSGLRAESPALSMLSESSFVSIYGRNTTSQGPSPADSSPSPPDSAAQARMPGFSSPLRVTSATPNTRPTTARSASSNYAQFHNITDVLGMPGSPLGRLEKLDPQTSRPQTSAHERSPYSRPPITQTQPMTKEEKREALERVLTQGKYGRDHGLPPTPDTISTTTLRHYKDSNDTLSQAHGLSNERSYLALSDTTVSHHSTPNEIVTGLVPPVQTIHTQAASTTAFDSRKPFSSGDTNYDPQCSASQVQRPRATGPTSLDHPRAERDGEDSGDEQAAEENSRPSSADTWLRESLEPGRPDGLGPMSSVSQANPRRKQGRASPDLFSFPSSSKGWATNAMFGNLGGTGYMRAGGKASAAGPPAGTLDKSGGPSSLPAIGSSILTPSLATSANPAPPPPNRRSSLQAKTTNEASMPTAPTKSSPLSKLKKGVARGTRARSNSTDLQPPLRHSTDMAAKQDRAMTVPPKQVHLPPPPPPPPSRQDTQTRQEPQHPPLTRPRHYPPTASHGAAVRPRSRGLNIFRRSTGSADQGPVAPSSAPAPETISKVAAERHGPGIIGMPSWGRRNSFVEDDRDASATPPPIQRNRNLERRVEFDDDVGGVELEPAMSNDARLGGVPISERKHAPSRSIDSSGGVSLGNGVPVNNGASGSGGGKRKWLGLGRRSSSRNRGAA